MAILCLLGLHRPGPFKIRNDFRDFTRCVDCSTDLVRRSRWAVPPPGTRIRWRLRTAQDIFPLQLADNRDRRRSLPRLVRLLRGY